MVEIKEIDEPISAYKQIKEAFHQNAEEFFDNLVKETNTDASLNKTTCENYYKKLNELSDTSASLKKIKRKRTFFKVLAIICFITIILIPVGVMLTNKIHNELDSQISGLNNQNNKQQDEANTIKEEATKQTANINASYDWNMAANLIHKTIPLIETDTNFANRRLELLSKKYGYKEHDENDVSTVHVQTGSILGNPFVIERNFVQEMSLHTYVGTLLIHWTTHSNGKSYSHTQTLTATVMKPAPIYYYDTWFVYGNEAAPKLIFTRSASNVSGMSDKEIEKKVKKEDKKIDRVAKKDLSFTKMGNSEFESLFHATDRNDEVEFRLLFTPLAQQNMINLIRMKEPYGDDFFFRKEKQLNFIKTKHSQSFDYSCDPSLFINFDLAKSKEAFVNYCDQYFQSFYFDLAPLLCIPLYQNYKSKEFIYGEDYKRNITSFETEAIANKFDRKMFQPAHSDTDSILKCHLIKKDGDKDIVEIHAHSFQSISHVELVPTLGGDGRMHAVPVTWFEYKPVIKKTPFVVSDISTSRKKYLDENKQNIFSQLPIKSVYFQKGLLAAILKGQDNQENKEK